MLMMSFKNRCRKFQRPRPYHLADNMKMEFDFMPLHSDSMKSPAYPSGHSLQSRLLANHFSKKYPNHKEGLIKAAEECGMGRVYSGWHYPSDHDASVKLANEVSPKIQMDMDEAYKRDYKAEYKKFQSSPERIAYRAQLVKYNRDKGTYGNGDGLDASHKGDKIVGFEKESKNKGRREKSRLKGSTRIKEDVSKSDLDQVEKYADKLFAAVGIDVEFTRHFLDRVNDIRNKTQITVAELIRMFRQSYKKHGKKIAQLGPDAEAVLNDMQTDINVPFVLKWDGKELDLVAKTVMRKKNFGTPNPKLSF